MNLFELQVLLNLKNKFLHDLMKDLVKDLVIVHIKNLENSEK